MPVLSKVQQNAIFDIAVKAGLNPADFAWTSENQQYRGLTDIITHRPTGARLDFSYNDDKTWIQWWPKFHDGKTSYFEQRWALILATVHRWMAAVKQNHDAPDLWAEAAKERQLTDAAGNVGADNTPSISLRSSSLNLNWTTLRHTSSHGNRSTSNRRKSCMAVFNTCWVQRSAASDVSTGSIFS